METEHSRRTQPTGLLAAAVMCVGILGGVGTAEAAKVPKVDICHLDADTEVFTKISISGNALEQHVGKHGDLLPGVDNGPGTLTLDADCNEALTGPEVLVRAYIDKNRNGTYEAHVDPVIAELVDKADDDVPSVGDTIRLSHYPTSFDPCPPPPSTAPCSDIGNFSPDNTLVVTQLEVPTERFIQVSTDSGTTYSWFSLAGGVGSSFAAIPPFTGTLFTGINLSRDIRFRTQDTLSVLDTTGYEMWASEPTIALVQLDSAGEVYWVHVEFPAP